MKALTGLILFVAVMAAVGCASVQVSQDYDPRTDLSSYSTWQWREPLQPLTGDVRTDNPLLDKRIRAAVAHHLVRRGFDMAKVQPELYLVYHLNIEPKIQGDTYRTTVGAGNFYPPLYGGMATESHIRQYDESRLTIDIFSADTGELIWRGVGIYRLISYETPREAAAAVQKIIDKILQQFPPAGTGNSELGEAPFFEFHSWRVGL